MPITLAKLFSPTATVSFPFLGETVNVVWAPFRYTGEMQELADRIAAEQAVDTDEIARLRASATDKFEEAARLEQADSPDPEAIAALRTEAAAALLEADASEVRLDHRDKAAVREVLSKLLVSWDVLDEAGKPIGTDVDTLARLPDVFNRTVFFSLSQENVPDPTKAPPSDEPSSSKTATPSPTGSPSSRRRAPSASAPSSSTSGPSEPAIIPPGDAGP